MYSFSFGENYYNKIRQEWHQVCCWISQGILQIWLSVTPNVISGIVFDSYFVWFMNFSDAPGSFETGFPLGTRRGLKGAGAYHTRQMTLWWLIWAAAKIKSSYIFCYFDQDECHVLNCQFFDYKAQHLVNLSVFLIPKLMWNTDLNHSFRPPRSDCGWLILCFGTLVIMFLISIWGVDIQRKYWCSQWSIICSGPIGRNFILKASIHQKS